jgi:tetratricopeptide (TPR) repeat protein
VLLLLLYLGCTVADASQALTAPTALTCQPGGAGAALAKVAGQLQQLDEDGAQSTMRQMRSLDGLCRELSVASLAIEGWIEARRLAAFGGAPDQLGAITHVLQRLRAIQVAAAPAALIAQLAGYADAVLRAAVAAAQDERDEMQLYLAHARDLAGSLALGKQSTVWPLSIDEVEGELWLEVDRYVEARAAFQQAAEAGRGARALVGLARTLDRLGEVTEACAAYRRADLMALAEAARQNVRAALARPACAGR